MATAREILAAKKFGGVVTVSPECSVRNACCALRDHNIGALVVFDGETYCGIFTERDVVKRVVAEGLDPSTTEVREVMTAKVIFVRPERPMNEIEAIMRQERIRHLAVVADSGLVGIISIGDVTARHAVEADQRIDYLTEYMFGRA